MAQLDAADIDALARLARLAPSDTERVTLLRQLGAIVGYLDLLAAVDIEGVAPWRPPAPVAAPLRDDVARAPMPAEDLLRGAPVTAEGLVVVPRFVES